MPKKEPSSSTYAAEAAQRVRNSPLFTTEMRPETQAKMGGFEASGIVEAGTRA
jgi:hypothetical protein